MIDDFFMNNMNQNVRSAYSHVQERWRDDFNLSCVNFLIRLIVTND